MDMKMIVNGELLSKSRMTLGDLRLLKQHFGVIGEQGLMSAQDGDPDAIAGLVYLALKEAHPEWEHARLMNTVNDIDLEGGFEAVDTEAVPAGKDVSP